MIQRTRRKILISTQITAAPTNVIFRATDATICDARDLWLANRDLALQTLGPIATWDTSRVTTMACLFSPFPGCKRQAGEGCKLNRGAGRFNDDISAWDTSSVTNMYGMFGDNSQFNKDISGWDTSAVTTMEQMFAYAPKFDQPLQNWDVSRVTSMAQIFNRATAFNQALGWCVSADLTDAFVGTRCGSYDCGVSSPPSCVP